MSKTENRVSHELEPERLDLRSHDIAADRRRELLRLSQEVRTEDHKLDFDRLKLALGQTPSLGTLGPCRRKVSASIRPTT